MRPIYLLLATVALSCFAVYSIAANGSKPTPLPDPRGTERQPLIVKASAADSANAAQEHATERSQDLAESSATRALHHADKEKELNLGQKTLVVSTGVGVFTIIILIVQARAFWTQTEQLRASVREMQTATGVAKSAAESARTAAEAAIASNTISQKALIAGQRPWVAIVGDPPIVRVRRTADGWSFHLDMKLSNPGHSPAHNVSISSVAAPFVSDEQIDRLQEVHNKLIRDLVGDVLQTVLFPGEMPQKTTQANLDGIGRPEWESGLFDQSIVIYGSVYYRFTNEDTTHITSFRYRLMDTNGQTQLPHEAVPNDYPAHINVYRDNRGWFAD
jgi:hypothetical protein